MNNYIKDLLDKYPEEMSSYTKEPTLDEEIDLAKSSPSIPSERSYTGLDYSDEVPGMRDIDFRNSPIEQEYVSSVGRLPSVPDSIEPDPIMSKILNKRSPASIPSEIPSSSRVSEAPSASRISSVPASAEGSSDSNLSEFQKMQREADRQEGLAMILKAGQQFGHSFKGAKPADTSIADAQIKSAQDRMRQYQEWKKSEEDRKARVETAKENRLARQQNFALQQQLLKDNKESKQQEKQQILSDKETTKISERMTKSGLTGINQQIDEIETLLGKPLEEAKELPGYGRVGSLVPNILSGPEQRAVRQKAQALQNLQISKQYGASQTSGEVARFGKESGSGYFESEESMLNYLRAIKKAAKNDEKVIMSGAKDKGKEYKERMNMLEEESPQTKKQTQSSIPESAIEHAMKLNPGRSREEIEQAIEKHQKK